MNPVKQDFRTVLSITCRPLSEDVTRDGQRIRQSVQIKVSSVLITKRSNYDLLCHRFAFQLDEKSRRIVLQCYTTAS